MIAKAYLGDGVYAEVERGMIKLTTENGIEILNTIFLEPEVVDALIRFYHRVCEAKTMAGRGA